MEREIANEVKIKTKADMWILALLMVRIVSGLVILAANRGSEVMQW